MAASIDGVCLMKMARRRTGNRIGTALRSNGRLKEKDQKAVLRRTISAVEGGTTDSKDGHQTAERAAVLKKEDRAEVLETILEEERPKNRLKKKSVV